MADNYIRGGTILASILKEKGVENVFTLAGGFCNAGLEGMMKYNIRTINCPHEQVAGFLADGYCRLTRKPTVCFVGPEGFANTVGAMIEAWGERTPIIYITSSSTLRRKGAGGFKEINDVAIAEPLTKYSVMVTDGLRIREVVDRAWTIATNGYPGAVHISIPVDIMFASFPEDAGKDERPIKWHNKPTHRAWPDPERLANILEIIQNAKKPVFVVGHGVWWSHAEKALEEVSSELNIPVFNMSEHKKILPQNAKAYIGFTDEHQNPAAGYAFNECDVIIALGCVLDNTLEFGNPPLFSKSSHLICVNGSDEEIIFNKNADSSLLSDPNAFLSNLMKLKTDNKWTLSSQWLDSIQQHRKDWAKKVLAEFENETGREDGTNEKVHPLRLSLEVQKVLGENDWLVYDGGNTHFWAEIGVNIAGAFGQKLAGILNVSSYSMLGVGVPFAIAAKDTYKDARVVVISGDGAFMAGGMSIEVAFEQNIPIVVVIDNNMGLDCISEQQERMFPNKAHFATDFRNIPFDKMIEGLGGYAETVEKYQDIVPALERAFASNKPACINVLTKGVITPVIEDMTMRRDDASIE
ncbi:thiamine pyrophosphate-binding protein [Francisella philomiragia]|uniref:thiamine pyrophosphate-binding protein n=1 Tax=Francisella philomiragia TaxID=28110 RepID=UPI000B58E63E|nr:thiamine pyrophosphate-binding protein [Francisella philomiragia]MBK2094650.1 thiamine pyrophosphate-binding protein [Francisella philomiragia]